MKITIDVSPEEIKELFSVDKLIEMQQEVAKEMIKQSLNNMAPNDAITEWYKKFWEKKD
jgi:hypothetical protein